MKLHNTVWLLMLCLFFLVQCGVKGPPLPPIPSTPEQADRMEQVSARPTPSPRPSPSPSVPSGKKIKKKK